MKKITDHNSKELSRKLQKLATSVAKKPVYIIAKTELGFNIVHYITGDILIQDIPFVKLAEKIVTNINKSKKVNYKYINDVRAMLDEYYKHYNDALFCKHILSSDSANLDTETVYIRLDIANWQITKIKHELMKK